jgi:competence protein ComEC
VSVRLRSLSAGLALLAVVWLAVGSREGPPRLTFLAVGQGDAIVWQDSGVTVMVDAGPRTREGFDAGERIVLPKLRKMGVRRLDLLLITHPDLDHIGGLPALAKRFPDAKVGLNSGFRDNPDMQAWIRSAKLKEGQLLWIEGRSRFRFGEFDIEVAAPPIVDEESDNEGSLFVRISRGKAHAVLTGDASIETEMAMQKGLKWTAQVLKAGHHGSRTSTAAAFVRAVNPDWAVVSCGRSNRFDHPHRSVLETLAANAVEVYRTDLQGDVSFEARANGFVPLLRSVAPAP